MLGPQIALSLNVLLCDHRAITPFVGNPLSHGAAKQLQNQKIELRFVWTPKYRSRYARAPSYPSHSLSLLLSSISLHLFHPHSHTHIHAVLARTQPHYNCYAISASLNPYSYLISTSSPPIQKWRNRNCHALRTRRKRNGPKEQSPNASNHISWSQCKLLVSAVSSSCATSPSLQLMTERRFPEMWNTRNAASPYHQNH